MTDLLDVYRPSSISYFAFARHALVEALRQSGIGNGDRVALPGFICRDVLASSSIRERVRGLVENRSSRPQ